MTFQEFLMEKYQKNPELFAEGFKNDFFDFANKILLHYHFLQTLHNIQKYYGMWLDYVYIPISSHEHLPGLPDAMYTPLSKFSLDNSIYFKYKMQYKVLRVADHDKLASLSIPKADYLAIGFSRREDLYVQGQLLQYSGMPEDHLQFLNYLDFSLLDDYYKSNRDPIISLFKENALKTLFSDHNKDFHDIISKNYTFIDKQGVYSTNFDINLLKRSLDTVYLKQVIRLG